MVIDRHPIESLRAARQADEAENVFVHEEMPQLQKTPGLQTQLGSALQTLVFWLSADDPDAGSARLVSAAAKTTDLWAGMYLAAAVKPDNPLSVVVDGAPMTFHGNGIHFDIALDTWMSMYWWYRLSRSRQSRAAVNVLTKEQVLRDGQWARDRVHMYDALVALDNGNENWIDHIHLALGTVGSSAPTNGLEAKYLHEPLLHMLVAINDVDQHGFTEALATGVKLHRKFWTRGDRYVGDCEGFTSIPLAAICALAVDRGLTVDVESDYLPTGLITPGWYPS